MPKSSYSSAQEALNHLNIIKMELDKDISYDRKVYLQDIKHDIEIEYERLLDREMA